ncbi:MAG TPA: malto-oligosyltrehalose trehalohydrolase [Gemmataceae bacterium]|nr:malto-oligosyltrehalose trehalohydrolase [Gemmataceae bacterium]
MNGTQHSRRLPVGAEVQPQGGVHFRVWAPKRRRVEVVLRSGRGAPGAYELAPEPGGYFAGFVAAAGPGTLYGYRLDGGSDVFPDPATRFQPEGPHGPSEVIDPGAFRWTDHGWRGVAPTGQVVYEMHVGTFTPEGTFEAALRELPALADLGVTLVEVMPVADFAGRFGWGYDGVDYFAPTRLYGRPDDFRRFVDQAHALGLGVILDVVYNHFGPDGNYISQFSDNYFSERHHTDWGQAINYDGPNAGPVREFVTANAGYWIDEYHLDGLRLDATQNVYDDSPDHVLAAVTRQVREKGRGRSTFVVAENEPQHVRLVRPPDKGGYGMDALWNDDFHHTALVALTGRNEAYYTDYKGTPQEFISCAKWGYLYQGQHYRWQNKRRGTPSYGVPAAAFVTFIENHDQVSNSARGLRCHALTSPGRYRALTGLLLLGPGTPMLFQGQEFASSSPFHFFADHTKDLAPLVRRGRQQFLSQFPSIVDPDVMACVPDPADPKTFQRCKLDWSERDKHAGAYALHRDLLRLRRDDPVFGGRKPVRIDGAVLTPQAFVLRWFGGDGDDRLLVVNLGRETALSPAPEPLLAPPEGRVWRVVWSSEAARYGGCGAPPPEAADGWHLPGEAALALAPATPGEVRSWTI